jgi:hypothetical protein
MDILFWLLLLLLFGVPPFLLLVKKRNERTRVINIEINGKKSRRVQSLKGQAKTSRWQVNIFWVVRGKLERRM